MNMKKKSFVFFLLLLFATVGYAQETKKSFWDNFVGNVSIGAGTEYKGMTPITMDVELGYKFFKGLYAFASVEGGYLHFKGDEDWKTYGTTQNLGGGLGYDFGCIDKNLGLSIGVQVKMAGTIGSVDCKRLS